MITRPTKLYMADTAVTSPQSPVESGATRVPLERAPHSIDLDITLEDKDKVHVCVHAPLSASESTSRIKLA